MSNVIGYPIYMDEICSDLKQFEEKYGITTDEFLARFNDLSDDMEGIEDAYEWYLDARLYYDKGVI